MSKILGYVLIFALQILVLNHLDLGLYLFPQVFIIFLISMPPHINRAYQILIAFAIGLIADMFIYTPGLHASASLLLVFVRMSLLRRYEVDDLIASRHWVNSNTLGIAKYLAYLAIMVLLYHLYVFALEAIPHLNSVNYLLTVLLSSLAAFLIILLLQFMFIRKGRA